MSGLCEHCVQGYTLEGTPSGSLEGSAYFHPAPSPSTRAVVILSDIFGLNLVNPKLITDEYSRRLKCDVWCPDLFQGSPPFTEAQLGPLVSDVPNQKTTFLSKLKLIFTLLGSLPGLIKNRPSVVDVRITNFVKKIKEEKKYEKIGVIGFCFGGTEAVRLGSAGLFDSAIVAHPGRITIAQIEAINIPTSWICAEEDFTFGPKLRNEAEAALKRKKEAGKISDYEFQDYKGTTHGFAARPNLGIPEIKKAFEDAFDQSSGWFEKTLA